MLISAALLLGGCTVAGAFEPAVNYMLHCMGCHTPDGRGEPGRVPSVRNTLAPMAATPAGRRYLVQVPGSAQSTLSDSELAEVLNWMVANLSEAPAPCRVARFTAAEVASYRHEPLVAVAAARQELMRTLGQ